MVLSLRPSIMSLLASSLFLLIPEPVSNFWPRLGVWNWVVGLVGLVWFGVFGAGLLGRLGALLGWVLSGGLWWVGVGAGWGGPDLTGVTGVGELL